MNYLYQKSLNGHQTGIFRIVSCAVIFNKVRCHTSLRRRSEEAAETVGFVGSRQMLARQTGRQSSSDSTGVAAQ